jgi:hypothetical protein
MLFAAVLLPTIFCPASFFAQTTKPNILVMVGNEVG